MDLGYSGNEGNHIDYQDIRDDRVYSYFSLRNNQSKTIKVKLHAAYVGEYYMPAVHIEAMYDASISALKKGARSEEHTSELQSRPHLVCRLLLEKKKKK